jgi:hypothetical protein
LKPVAALVKLQILDLNQSAVQDLAPLSHCLALRELRMATPPDAGGPAPDVAPIAACSALERILLPRAAIGIAALRTLPKLRFIAYELDKESRQVSRPATEFWAEFDALLKFESDFKPKLAKLDADLKKAGVTQPQLANAVVLKGKLDLNFDQMKSQTSFWPASVRCSLFPVGPIEDLSPVKVRRSNR